MEIFEIVIYFILLGLISTAIRVVTTSNVIHAAISLVFTLALTAILFLILSSEFVALVLVLVYIGAVIVLFLFGIMITRAPLGKNAELDNDKNKKFSHLTITIIDFFYNRSSLSKNVFKNKEYTKSKLELR